MTISHMIEKIREEHQGCCVTTNCRDGKCSLRLNGLIGSSMLIISGTMYQRAHPATGKLCDRIILSSERGGFVCAVELKGGRTQPRLPPIAEQIQSGINIAQELLAGILPQRWYPVLAFSGHSGPNTSAAFRAKRNLVQAPGALIEIARHDCNSELVSLLSN